MAADDMRRAAGPVTMPMAAPSIKVPPIAAPMIAAPMIAAPTMPEVIPAMTPTVARVPEEELAGGRPASASRWLTAVVRTTRPRQWPKNLLVFAAPLAGATMGRPYGPGYAAGAAVGVGCGAPRGGFVHEVLVGEPVRAA